MENKKDIVKNNNKKDNLNNIESPYFSAKSSPILESCNNEIDNNNNLDNYELQETPEKDINFDTLILNLKIISKLKPGYKLSLKENEGDINYIYIDTSYFQFIYRIFSENSRDNTTNFLEKLDKQITKKIEQIVKKENYNDSNMFLNSKENILLDLSHNLNLTLVGLNNLINTYSNDEYIISKIEMIINNFELKIRKISNILKVN
jgi:hypothetical protein